MARKLTDYSLNEVVRELNTLYQKEIMNGFLKAKRYDLFLGFAATEKGAVLKDDEQILFFKDDYDNQGPIKRPYADRVTESIRDIYLSQIKGKAVEPNVAWRLESYGYITPAYIKKLQNAEKMLFEKGTAWDMLAFAEHAPHADLTRIEEAIIKDGNSLILLAYAIDVAGADVNKIREAMEKICARDKQIPNKREVANMHKEHLGIFYDRFGYGSESAVNE